MEQIISPRTLSNFIGQSQKQCMHASNIYIRDCKHTALQLALDYIGLPELFIYKGMGVMHIPYITPFQTFTTISCSIQFEQWRIFTYFLGVPNAIVYSTFNERLYITIFQVITYNNK
jgi:hypothetical protein